MNKEKKKQRERQRERESWGMKVYCGGAVPVVLSGISVLFLIGRRV